MVQSFSSLSPKWIIKSGKSCEKCFVYIIFGPTSSRRGENGFTFREISLLKFGSPHFSLVILVSLSVFLPPVSFGKDFKIGVNLNWETTLRNAARCRHHNVSLMIQYFSPIFKNERHTSKYRCWSWADNLWLRATHSYSLQNLLGHVYGKWTINWKG